MGMREGRRFVPTPTSAISSCIIADTRTVDEVARLGYMMDCCVYYDCRPASPLHMVPARWMSRNHTPSIKATPVISQATMALFSKEGYSFAGPAFALEPGTAGVEVLSEMHKQDHAENGAHQEQPARLVVAVRVTSDGLMYTKAVPGPGNYSHRRVSAAAA